MTQGSLIAIDWGSSQYRAYLLNENGDIIDKTESSEGVFCKKNASFQDILSTSCKQWFEANARLPVIMSGMIGSQQGWVETAYLPCPISIDQLCEQLATVPDIYDNPLFIVPGIASSDLSAFKDVMRGEETQLFGLLSNSTITNAVVCLPGTHSKWALVEGERIKNFMTFLTGELFDSIKMSASIRPVITIEEYNDHAFDEGVRISRTPGGLSHHIFSIRSRLVSRESSFGTYSSYLSGLLIGTEIIAGLEQFSHTEKIMLVGNSSLTHHYRKAFSQFNVDIESIDSEQTSVMGLWKIANKSKSINLNVT